MYYEVYAVYIRFVVFIKTRNDASSKKSSLLAVDDGLLVEQGREGVNPKTVEPVKNIIIIADASIVHFMDGVVYATHALRWVRNDHVVKLKRKKHNRFIHAQNIIDLRAWTLIKTDNFNKLILYNYYYLSLYLLHIYND